MQTTYQIIDGAITATDLKAEIATLTGEKPGIEIETANVIVGGNAELAQVIFIPAFGRAGIVRGSCGVRTLNGRTRVLWRRLLRFGKPERWSTKPPRPGPSQHWPGQERMRGK